MKTKLKWHEDPVVLLEKAVMPVLSLTPTVFVRKEMGETVAISEVTTTLNDAVRMLRTSSIAMLRARNVPFEPADIAPLHIAADSIEALARDLVDYASQPLDSSFKMKVLKHYADVVIGQIETAVDAFRAVFISCVLDRQWQSAQRSERAIARLDQISKQIFFISINASVEAARAGDAGRSFQQISSDIRALSQSAQEATRSLTDTGTGSGPAF